MSETTASKRKYDNLGVGDGNLTKQTMAPGAGLPYRDTCLYYDWRNRLVASDNGIQVTYNTLNNLGQATQTDTYDAKQANTAIVVTNGIVSPPTNATALRTRGTNLYDDQGQVYCTQTFWVDQTNGTVGGSLYSYFYHDGRGHVVISSLPSDLMTVTDYDGLGGSSLKPPAMVILRPRSLRSTTKMKTILLSPPISNFSPMARCAAVTRSAIMMWPAACKPPWTTARIPTSAT